MRKTACVGLMIAVWALGATALAQTDGVADPEARAAELEDQLRTLQRGTSELRAQVGESHRRLAVIAMRLFDRVDGARVTIRHRNEVGPFYRLLSVTYAIDGQPVFHRSDDTGALGRSAELEIHDGILPPGEHTLSVVLRYVGDGGEVLSYLEGYRFAVRSSHSFVGVAGQETRLEIRTFQRSPEVPYEQRLGVAYRRTVAPWR